MSVDPGQCPSKHEWDVIVVGSGMGGATLGYSLAKAGKRVLFCEKGRKRPERRSGQPSDYPEIQGGRSGAVLGCRAGDALLDAGRCAEELVDQSSSRERRFIPFIGSGPGGSSALYGMALERFFRSDFVPRSNHPGAPDTALEESWPVSYDELSPYYGAAEKLFRVRGADDPLGQLRDHGAKLAAAPELSVGGAEMFDFLGAKGLHPYRLPMACEFVPGCRGCQGHLCDRDCKNDSARVCLLPALGQFGASMLNECEVLAVQAEPTRASGVVCMYRGERLHLRARTVVLAAGALETPRILLDSTSADWPAGLANGSGQVGRNLMRHMIDLYLVRSELANSHGFDNRMKELAFNDFYRFEGTKMGSVQSFGRLPPAAMLSGSMQQDLRTGRFPFLASLFPVARPLLMPTLKRLVSQTTVLATTLEDLPYASNRVYRIASASGGASRMAINYRVRAEGQQRLQRMRMLMRDVLAPKRWRRVDQAVNNERIAHACGTCRFGTDPRTSCLDRNNRVHDLDNLYVVDSSFFPSSGGTNPSLTIAANALRVADHLAR